MNNNMEKDQEAMDNSIQKVINNVKEAWSLFGKTLTEIIKSLNDLLTPVVDWVQENQELFCLQEAVNLGLVSPRTSGLYFHHKHRVVKKTKNRVLRKLKLYIKRHPNFKKSLVGKVMGFSGNT